MALFNVNYLLNIQMESRWLMCGSIYNTYEFPGLAAIKILALLKENHTVQEIEQYVEKTLNVRPTTTITTIIPAQGSVEAVTATWWLKLEWQKGELIPDSQWKTFNCKSTKLLKSPIHNIKPISRRTIIVAEGFHEWQPIYPGNRLYSQLTTLEKTKLPTPIRKQCFLIKPVTGICRIAAVSKKWMKNKYSTGIITLPGHPAFQDIHHKSFPLIIQADEVESWLDPKVPTSAFEPLFSLTDFRETWEAIPVKGPTDNSVMGDVLKLMPGSSSNIN